MLPERKCEGDGEMFDQCSKPASFDKCCAWEMTNEKRKKKERERGKGETTHDETRRDDTIRGARIKYYQGSMINKLTFHLQL